MTVLVRYYVLFWIHAGRIREERVELPKDATVEALVSELGRRHGSAFVDNVRCGDKLHPFCWVLLNGRRLGSSCFSEVAREGDEIVFTTPLVVGG